MKVQKNKIENNSDERSQLVREEIFKSPKFYVKYGNSILLLISTFLIISSAYIPYTKTIKSSANIKLYSPIQTIDTVGNFRYISAEHKVLKSTLIASKVDSTTAQKILNLEIFLMREHQGFDMSELKNYTDKLGPLDESFKIFVYELQYRRYEWKEHFQKFHSKILKWKNENLIFSQFDGFLFYEKIKGANNPSLILVSHEHQIVYNITIPSEIVKTKNKIADVFIEYPSIKSTDFLELDKSKFSINNTNNIIIKPKNQEEIQILTDAVLSKKMTNVNFKIRESSVLYYLSHSLSFFKIEKK